MFGLLKRKKGTIVRQAGERRRTKRLPLCFQIEVAGRDRDTGTSFREQTVTMDVNENGCRFSLLRKLHPGDAITILIRGRDSAPLDLKMIPFDVVWVEPSDRGWTVGAENLQRQDIWHVKFPHADEP